MNDRDVYLKLCELADELSRMADEAESLIGEAALRTMASNVAGAAKAIYDHALGGDLSH